MGGTALGQTTRRLDIFEYNIKVHELIKVLLDRRGVDMPHDFKVINPPSYESKESHGDIDLVLNYQVFPEQIKDWFGDVKIAYNSHNPTLSFLYDGVQVDLIRSNPLDFELVAFYLSYNDLNALVGRVATWQGLNFGLQGLFAKIKHPDNPEIQKDIILSKSPRYAYEVLGYDYDRWLEGFKTQQEIFEFVVSSPYFDKSFFPFERNTSTRATRDKKRKMYVDFLEFLQTVPDKEVMTLDYENLPEYKAQAPIVLSEILMIKKRADVMRKFKDCVVANLQNTNPKAVNSAMQSIMNKALEKNPNFKDDLLTCPDIPNLAARLVSEQGF